MSIRILVPGRPLSAAEAAATRDGVETRGSRDMGGDSVLPATHLFDTLQVLAAYDISAGKRGSLTVDGGHVALELRDDDLVEWELEGGFKLWMSAAAFRDEQQRYRPESVRDGVLQWTSPRQWRGDTRGFTECKDRVVRFLRLAADDVVKQASDPGKWPQALRDRFGDILAKKGVELGAWATIKALAWLLEAQLTPGPGLYHWPEGPGPIGTRFAQARPVKEVTDIPSDRPILVCLHGTASSTVGSFAYLHVVDPKSGGPRQQEWQRLSRHFGPYIYAWEHRTLGESPIENALELAKLLPPKARISLLSHSRGGLVGDLLCLPGIPLEWQTAYSHGPGLAAADQLDKAQLAALHEVLAEKQFVIERFARVACPARGTSLASESIERFLSLLLHLIGLIPGLSTSVCYRVFKRFVLEVAKNRTNAKLIPGIAAMAPDSPLIRLLNMARETTSRGTSTAPITAKGQLGVVAGDWGFEGAGIAQSLLVPISDYLIFGGGDNDWVVDTESMFLGAPRQGDSYYIFDQGGDVSHFKYFENARTRVAVADWLVPAASDVAAPSAPGGSAVPANFHKLTDPARPKPMTRAPTRAAARAAAPVGTPALPDTRPLLFFVPDLFGSQLVAHTANGEDQPVWLDFEWLAREGLSRLSLEDLTRSSRADLTGRALDVNATQLTPRLSDFYTEWFEALSVDFEVVPCPYDWRQSIEESAERLLKFVEEELPRQTIRHEAPGRVVGFMAHGMGALVAQEMFAAASLTKDHGILRAILTQDQRLRLLTLGAPRRGMAAVAAMLTGLDSSLRRLALLHPAFPLPKVLELFASFPGLLELLPDEPRWFLPETWQRFREANGGLGALPSGVDLSRAEQTIRKRRSSEGLVGGPAGDRVLSVLGSAPRTPRDLLIERHQLAVDATDSGDGRVTHESSLAASSQPFYVETDHGGLASNIELLPAYKELLERGVTARLSRTPSRWEDRSPTAAPKPVLFPTRGELLDDLLAKHQTPAVRAKTRQVKLSVLHGDLRHAKYPVMVGHYEGDTIGGVERYLDKKLRGMLVDRYRMGSYPGPLGHSLTVVPRPKKHQHRGQLPAGAVVIGLGRMGDLSSGTLTQAVRDGLIDYALAMAARDEFADDAPQQPANQELGVSLLIIGSQTAATMTIEDCVVALLRGVAWANRELERSRNRPRIAAVEIVELFLDSAIAAVGAASRIKPVILREFGTELVFEHSPARLSRHPSGRLRIDPLPTSHTWRRWEVTALPAPTARESVLQLPAALREFLREALRAPSATEPAIHEALFDLAFPNPQVDVAIPFGLRFVAMTDRARAEKNVAGKQRPVIDDLIRQAIDSGEYRREISKTLGQLLIPNDLKDSLSHLDRLVMVLDAETATIPWELLVLDDAPLATRIGLVRQLVTADYRQNARSALPRAAYVVGNPATRDDIPSLDGAQSEAREVAAMLEDSGFFVEDRYTERAQAHEVFAGLLQRPYRVLHLAGHGYFARHNGDKPTRYGMLLNNNQYLTAQEIQQLPQVPDLVFINCCHLAGIEDDAKRERQFEYSKLSASLAEELIKMGVRAIVAAGWAVRDDLAKDFATTFYTQMLAGEPFGDAVTAARVAVWQSAPGSNTWAAYQAYGDPDYRLRSRHSGGASPRSKRSSSTATKSGSGGRGPRNASRSESSPFVTPRQLLEKLRQIAVAAPQEDEASLRDPDSGVDSPAKTLDALVAACPAEWQNRVDVLSGFGRAYAALEEFQPAIDYLRRAERASHSPVAPKGIGQLTFQTIERLADCEIRQALLDSNTALVNKAIERLNTLCQFAKTPARLSLRGAAHKAKAAIGSPVEAQTSLTAAHEDFLEAARLEACDSDGIKRQTPRWVRYRSEAVALQIARGEPLSPDEREWLGLSSSPPLATTTSAKTAPAAKRFFSIKGGNHRGLDLALFRALQAADRPPSAPLPNAAASPPKGREKKKKAPKTRSNAAASSTDQERAVAERAVAEAATKFAEQFAKKYRQNWTHRRATPRSIRAALSRLELFAKLLERRDEDDMRAAMMRALIEKLNSQQT